MSGIRPQQNPKSKIEYRQSFQHAEINYKTKQMFLECTSAVFGAEGGSMMMWRIKIAQK